VLLLPFDDKIFFMWYLLPLTKVARNEQYRSTAHRGQFCRAL